MISLHATTDVTMLLLALARYSGSVGNTIFFVSSAWFLLERGKRPAQRKVLNIMLDVWVISVGIFLAMFILRRGDISPELVLHSFIPTILGSNWYISCYLLFLLLYPYLNTLIEKMQQRELFRVTVFLFIVYAGFNFIFNSTILFGSKIILWITIYFGVAYTKKCLAESTKKIGWNIGILLIGVLGNIIIFLATNYLGLHSSIFYNELLRWASDDNPFTIFSVVAAFNIARNITFQSRTVNRIAKLSMPVYLMHENVLLRSYIRPVIWQSIYTTFGYRHILLWVLALTAAIFLLFTVLSYLYSETVQKLVRRVSVWLYPRLLDRYERAEALFLKLH